MAEYLPLDLITEILTKLPVKSLNRFKCVSKTWNSLITSSNFIKHHLRQTLISNINTNLIISKNNSLLSSAISTVKLRFDIVNHPLKNIPHRLPVYISGSVHGVLLLVDFSKKTVCLFNPTNKTQRLVPPAASHMPAFDVCKIVEVFGFGYDSVTDDYKVVRLAEWENCERTGLYSETCVYSMRNDSWESVHDKSVVYPLQNTNATVVEELFWFVVRSWEGERMFKCFDLRTNTFSFLDFPELDKDIDNMFFNMRSLCGCLCLLVSYRKNNCELLYADVWEMKDSKWVKLFRVGKFEITKECMYLRLVAYSKDEKSVLIEVDSNWYGWYDLVTKKFKRVRVQGLGAVDSPYLSYPYVESLVSVYLAYPYVETLVSVENKKMVSKKEGTTRPKKNIKKNDFLSSGFKLKL